MENRDVLKARNHVRDVLLPALNSYISDLRGGDPTSEQIEEILNNLHNSINILNRVIRLVDLEKTIEHATNEIEAMRNE